MTGGAGRDYWQPSSTTPLQLSSIMLPQTSGAPGWTDAMSSRQSLHQMTPSPSWSAPLLPSQQAIQRLS